MSFHSAKKTIIKNQNSNFEVLKYFVENCDCITKNMLMDMMSNPAYLDIKIIKYIVEKGVNTNPVYEYELENDYEYIYEYHNIFHVLALNPSEKIDPKIVRFFLKNGVDVFARMNRSDYCFSLIFQNKKYEFFLTLLCNIKFYCKKINSDSFNPANFEKDKKYFDLVILFKRNGNVWSFENHHLFPKKQRRAVLYFLIITRTIHSIKIPKPILSLIVSLYF